MGKTGSETKNKTRENSERNWQTSSKTKRAVKTRSKPGGHTSAEKKVPQSATCFHPRKNGQNIVF